jgi:flagellar biosynthetic protein FlhB
MQHSLADLGARLVRALLMIGAVLGGAAVASQLALGGWNFTLKALGPRWNLLDPLAGLGRLFSGQNAGQALKAVLLAVLLGTVAAVALHQRLDQYVSLMSTPLEQALAQAGRLLLAGLFALTLALAVFAALDVPLQRQLYLRRLRMSRVEVKQEMKETEGSPEIKARQRARMRELTRQRMMAAVPKADLVVMNPTHYAVALKYDEAKDGAPRVVAKGADLLALRIRDVAKEHKVPVLQAPALARALYAHAKLDREVPLSLFGAVAQVLAWLYQLRAARPGREPLAPDPAVPKGMDPHEEQSLAPSDEELAE